MTKIELTYPIEIAGAKISTISMRRPKVKDQLVSEKAGPTSAEKEVRLFCNLCEVSPEVIQELDMVDYLQLQKAYTAFLF